MFKASLVINGVYCQLGNESLTSIISTLHERPETKEIYDELSKCPVARTREAVAQKGSLSDEAVQRLSGDRSPAVLQALVNNDAVAGRISKARLDEWIAANDTDMLLTIFRNLEHLQLDNAQVVSLMAVHVDPEARLEVARSSNTPNKLLHDLARDADSDVRDAALMTIAEKSDFDDDNE